MADGVPPFATYVPGADTASNASRRQTVRAVTLHRTQGTDSRGLGKNRKHNSPGTFNFLVRDEATYCYYPAWVRCSHAAGANRSGPGIEVEGFTGQPISSAQNERLDELTAWLSDTYGIPHTLWDGPDRLIDGSTYTGFVNHNSVATEPQYQHTDRITPEEFDVAISKGDFFQIATIVDNAVKKHTAPIQADLDALTARLEALAKAAGITLP